MDNEEIVKELELLIRDIKAHFHKVENPKLNVIRGINQIINKIENR